MASYAIEHFEHAEQAEDVPFDVLSGCCVCNMFLVFLLIAGLLTFFIYSAIKIVLVNTLGMIILIAMSLVNHLSIDCCKIENIIHHTCIGLESEVNLPGHRLWGLAYNTEYWIRDDEDKSADKCISRFCSDFYSMKTSDFYCGVGKCNTFGCNCNDGCRKNNSDSDFQKFERLFALEHGFVKKAKHKLF